MITKIKTPETREEWQALRESLKTIGGSEAAQAAGLSQWGSPLSIYANKLGLVPQREDNEAMRQGRDLEEYVAQRFAEATGLRVRRENHILINDEFPFAHANIDRKIVGEQAGLECKTTSVYNKTDFEGGDVPREYYVQCQHYMMVTGWSTWYLAVLVLNRGFYWFSVDRNESDIAALAELEIDLYNNHIVAQVPPDPQDNDGDVISQMYQESLDTYVPLDHLGAQLRELLMLKSQAKNLETAIKSLENLIKAEMGEASAGAAGDIEVTWKERISNRFDTTRFKKEEPDLYAKFTKESKNRTFLIKDRGESGEKKEKIV